MFVGAQACALSARKSVPCWCTSVPAAGAQECSVFTSARKRVQLAQKRFHGRRATVSVVGAQVCSLIVSSVGARACSLLAPKRFHCRRRRVFPVGASSHPVSAHTSVRCWCTSTRTVGAQECSLLARKRVRCPRINVFVVGAHTVCAQKVSWLTRKRAHSRKKSVHYRRAKVSVLGSSRSWRVNVFFAGACAACWPG